MNIKAVFRIAIPALIWRLRFRLFMRRQQAKFLKLMKV